MKRWDIVMLPNIFPSLFRGHDPQRAARDVHSAEFIGCFGVPFVVFHVPNTLACCRNYRRLTVAPRSGLLRRFNQTTDKGLKTLQYKEVHFFVYCHHHCAKLIQHHSTLT